MSLLVSIDWKTFKNKKYTFRKNRLSVENSKDFVTDESTIFFGPDSVIIHTCFELYKKLKKISNLIYIFSNVRKLPLWNVQKLSLVPFKKCAHTSTTKTFLTLDIFCARAYEFLICVEKFCWEERSPYFFFLISYLFIYFIFLHAHN